VGIRYRPEFKLFESRTIGIKDERKIPLFGGDTTTVEKGMIAAYGLNYFQVGYSAGKKAALVLKGQDPGTVPSGLTENLNLWVNLKAAKDQGVTVSEKFIKMAEKVFR